MKILYISFVNIIAVLLCTGCSPDPLEPASSKAMPPKSAPPRIPTLDALVPAEEAIKMDSSQARIVGELTEEELREVMILVGRLPNTRPEVKSIVVATNSGERKVTVITRSRFVEISDSDGEWSIKSAKFYAY